VSTVITITSGKTGDGGTSIAINLALALSELQSKVCIFDADNGLSNINALLGFTPENTIEQLLDDSKNLTEVIVDHPSGISIVPAANCNLNYAYLSAQQLHRLTAVFQDLQNTFDYLIVDTATGIDGNMLKFFNVDQYHIMVITRQAKSLMGA
jgi:flagellar biosynthesis protein FlhG